MKQKCVGTPRNGLTMMVRLLPNRNISTSSDMVTRWFFPHHLSASVEWLRCFSFLLLTTMSLTSSRKYRIYFFNNDITSVCVEKLFSISFLFCNLSSRNSRLSLGYPVL